MDASFDQFSQHPASGHRSGLAARPGGEGKQAALDWPGLSARLATAHDARQTLALASRQRSAAAGSFAPAVARLLDDWRAAVSPPSSPHVNLDAKADRKPSRTIGRIDAGEDRFLARGLP